jgi:hypothetical protein
MKQERPLHGAGSVGGYSVAVIVAGVVIALSIPRGRIRCPYAQWNRWII